VLIGAFAGLRVSEAYGLRIADVDFMRGVIRPAVQYPGEELKTDTSRTRCRSRVARAAVVGARPAVAGRQHAHRRMRPAAAAS